MKAETCSLVLFCEKIENGSSQQRQSGRFRWRMLAIFEAEKEISV